MKKSLEVAIVGCGVIGPVHAESFLRLPGVSVRWACDLRHDRASQMAQRFGIAHVTTDMQDVLKDPAVDVVAICTDHASHPALAIAALAAGKHVLCEKALAASREGLDELAAAVRRHPQSLLGGVLQHRFDPIFCSLRRLIQEGTFGTLLTASLHMRCLRTAEYYQADRWRGTWDQEGGSLMINQAIHFTDILQWTMGGVRGICGRYDNRTHQGIIETEDTAVASLIFHNGALGTLTATASSHIAWDPALSITGSAGVAEVREGALARLDLQDKAREAAARAEIESLSNGDGPAAAGRHYYGPSHPVQIADFVAAVREKRAPKVGFAEAREPVDLVLALYRSHREGGWVWL